MMDRPLSQLTRRTVTLVSLTVFLLVGAANVAAFDFGGRLDSSTSIREDSVFNSETLAAWVQGNIGENHSYQFQGSYEFTTDRPFLFDVDRLRLRGNYNVGENRVLATSLGRFSISDPTGVVLTHRIDGGQLRFSYPNAIATLSAGYTGLLLKPTASISMSSLDQFDAIDDDVILAPARLIGQADLRFPELFGSQTLFLSLVFQEDLRPESELVDESEEEQDPSGGGRVDTQYVTLGAQGPIASQLFYDLFGSFEGGRMLTYVEDETSTTGNEYRYKPVLAYMFGGSLRYYMPDVLGSRVTFRSVFTSGDEDHEAVAGGNGAGNSTLFNPIGTSTSSPVFAPGYGNLFTTTLSYSLKPFEGADSRMLSNLQTGVETHSFVRSSTGPVDASGIDTDSDALYLGTEVALRASFRPFSDLGVGFVSGLFFPNGANDGPFVEDQRSTQFLAKLDVSFSF
jgi:hypothetical protein